MTTVILAEKPNQASDYAKALGMLKRNDGYFTVSDHILKDETYVTFAIGHLVELAEPSFYDKKWEKWGIDSLPIFPNTYTFQVADDKKKQFNVVSGLLKKADRIIIATDSDREGENIAWSIIEKSGISKDSKEFKRLWINSLEKEAILEGFKNLKEGLAYYPSYKEAQTRQISDWLIGMNATQLYTLLLKEKGIQGVFSTGRVQSPTLYLVYDRQKKIEEFISQPYYEIENNVGVNQIEFKANLTPYKKFESKDNVKSFLSDRNAQEGEQVGIIESVDKESKNTKSPHLFSLSSLQAKANALFKATAKQTLQTASGLYDKKFLTYPRTDSHFITENEFSYLRDNFNKYCEFLGISGEIKQSEARKRYVDGSKVQEHYAIVPTRRTPSKEEFEAFKPLEKSIYLLVLKTTIAMFLDNYEYEETVIEIKVADLLFKAKGQVPLNAGWKEIFKSEEESEEKTEESVSKLPKVELGQTVDSFIKSVEKKTSPPAPYTEGTLITAMKTSGKMIDDEELVKVLQEVEGIGTEATRADVIESLKKRAYIEIKKNKVNVTEKGKIFCQAIEGQRLLKSAELTARWETVLKKIGQEEVSQEHFIMNIKKFIINLLEKVPEDIKNLDIKEYEKNKEVEENKKIVGKCPSCSKEIKNKGSFYGCAGYPECKFTLPNNFRKKKLTKTNVKELLINGETVVKGIKSKTSVYNAKIKLNSKNYLDFVEFERKK